MIGLILVTHGDLAKEFVAATEHVVGKQEQIACICITPEDDVESRRQEMIDTVANVNQGDGVIILTDMFGGTPSNLAISIMGEGNIEVIAGVNLPMMIKLCSMRAEGKSMEEIAMESQEAGRKYINVASNLLTKSDPMKKASGE